MALSLACFYFHPRENLKQEDVNRGSLKNKNKNKLSTEPKLPLPGVFTVQASVSVDDGNSPVVRLTRACSRFGPLGQMRGASPTCSHLLGQKHAFFKKIFIDF